MADFEPDRDVAEIAARILKDIPRMDRADLEKILKVTIDAALMQSATMAEQRSRIDQLEAVIADLHNQTRKDESK